MERDGADIGLIISDLGDGGAQRVFVLLAAHWSQAGRQVVAITQAGQDRDFFQLPDGMKRICAGGLGPSTNLMHRAWSVVKRHWFLRRAIKRAKVPVVVAFVGRTAISTIIASFGLGVRVVISERNDPSIQRLGFGWDWLRRNLYSRADIVTANSRGALRAMSRYVPVDRLAMVPNPVVLPDLDDSVDRARTFLAVGRLTPKKGFDTLVRGFAAIAADLPDWRLTIIGRGEMEEDLSTLAEELGVEDRVEFPGLVPDPSAYYAQAGIFVLTSRYEGTPNVLLEAMAAGMPVIVSDSSPGPLELLEGSAGVIVPGGDHHALANTMRRLARMPEECRRLGRLARAAIERRSPETIFEQWDAAVGFSTDLPERDRERVQT